MRPEPGDRVPNLTGQVISSAAADVEGAARAPRVWSVHGSVS